MVRAGNQQSAKDVLDPLVGGETSHADPAHASATAGSRSAIGRSNRPQHRRRRDHGRADEAGLPHLGLVEHGHGQPQSGAPGQLPKLSLGAQLVAGQRVVPGGVVLGRRHVVEVDHQWFGTCGQPWGKCRGRGELVYEQVARTCVFLVVNERPRVARCVGIDQLDINIRRDAPPRDDLAEAQCVTTHGVTTMEHRHELVDGVHFAARCPGASTEWREQIDEPLGRGGQLEVADPAPTGLDERRSTGIVRAQGRDCRCECVGILVGDEHPRIAEYLGHRAAVEGHDGQPRRHGLDHGDAETLVLRGNDEHIGLRIGGDNRGVAHVALEGDGV